MPKRKVTVDDDNPEWTKADFAKAAAAGTFADMSAAVENIKRGRGRPRVECPKQQVTLRLDADVVAALRNSGPGWMGRVNETLRRAISRAGGARKPTLARKAKSARGRAR